MTQQTRPFIPLHLIVLDFLGALLLGIGLASKYGRVAVLPSELTMEHRDTILIFLGMVLMLPNLWYLVRKASMTSGPRG